MGSCFSAQSANAVHSEYFKEWKDKTCNAKLRIFAHAKKVDLNVFERVIVAPKFVDWINTLDLNNYDVTEIEICHAFMFGPNVGFVIVNSIIEDRATQRKVPGIVFIRGGSVGVLVLFRDAAEGKTHMVLTSQFRTPAGQRLLEIPAGMLDDKTEQFLGVAAKELKEELDITIQLKELEYLGDFWPSPGGCDEKIKLFLLEREVSTAEIKEMQGKVTGAVGENEVITLQVQEFSLENIIKTGDAKGLAAAAMYLQKIKGVEVNS